MIATVEGIGRRFRELVAGLEVDRDYRIFHSTPQHDGSPHIEKVGELFYYVVTERGEELERRATKDPDEILYWLLDDVTRIVAIRYEISNRLEGTDGRELWFPYQENLLHEMNPDWGRRKREDHVAVLRNHPIQHKT